jgi:hypothetical protein
MAVKPEEGRKGEVEKSSPFLQLFGPDFTS